jgi:hypothetical protein
LDNSACGTLVLSPAMLFLSSPLNLLHHHILHETSSSTSGQLALVSAIIMSLVGFIYVCESEPKTTSKTIIHWKLLTILT